MARKFALLLLALFSGSFALAANGITYSGRIMGADGVTPVLSNSVNFKIWIRSTNQCVLYYEERTLDMRASAGTFAFDIGDGTATNSTIGPLGTASAISGITDLYQVFDNKKSFFALTGCAASATTFTASSSTEEREMVIVFNDGVGGDQTLPVLKITAVPAALQAYRLNGYDQDHVLKISQSVNSPTNPELTAPQLAEFVRLITNINTAYLPTTGDVTVVSSANKITSLQGVAVNAGSPTSGQALVYNGTAWEPTTLSAGSVTSVTASAPLASSGGTTPNITITKADAATNGYLDKTDWATFNNKLTSSLASGKIWVGNSGGTAAAVTMTGDAAITDAGLVTIDKTQTGTASKILQLDSSGVANSLGIGLINTGTVRILPGTPSTASYDLKLPVVAPAANQSLQSDALGNLSWVSPAGSTSYVNGGNSFGANASIGLADNYDLSINTNNATRMTILKDGNVGIGTAVPSEALHVNGNTKAAYFYGNDGSNNNPTYSFASSKDTGLFLYSGDTMALTNGGNFWARLDGTFGFYGNNTGMFSISSDGTGPTKPPYSFFGDFNTGMFRAGADILGFSTDGTERMQIDATGKVGIGTAPATTLDVKGITRTTGLDVNQTYGGSQASLRAPATFTSYTLTLPVDVGTVGQVLSTDGTGNLSWAAAAAAVDTTQTGTASKILQLDSSGVANSLGIGLINTGTVRILPGSPSTASYDLKLPVAAPAANQFMQSDASGNLTWVTSTGSTSYINGGNSFGANATLGTNDNYSLGFETNNVTRMSIASGGSVGVGIAAPWTDFMLYRANASAVSSIVSDNTSTTTARYPTLSIKNFGGTTGTLGTPSLELVNLRGNSSLAAVIQSGDALGAITFNGATSTTSNYKTGAEIRSYSTQNFTNTAVGSNLVFATTPNNSSTVTERMAIDQNGYVGIGTSSPRATLDVNGTILMKASVSNASTTIDFSTGNLQHTTANCGAFQLDNLKEGGSYSFAVKGTTSTTCSFTAFSGAGTGALTFHLPPGHGATTAGTHTVYTILVMGGDVYTSWVPGL